jgi:apoptosis-inducing factor 2
VVRAGARRAAELRRQLTALGAELLLGSPLRAEPPTAAGELGTFTVATQAGTEVTADIWFRCYGVTPASDYLAGGLAAARRPDGFIEVTPELLVTGQERVFALGDVSAADQNKGAGAAGRQARVVAGNIRALITGDGELARYQPPPTGIIVPIGPGGGAGQRPGTVDLVPAEMVAQLKGRDMMVQRFVDLLGLSNG